jgi:predicted DCC family thiol-disulfide oxidoreductase YuxK
MHDHEFEVFYDGECPLCSREIALTRALDTRERVRFTDISRPDFDAGALGLTQAELMGSIHGRTAAGAVVNGVEVFRLLYAAIGWKRLVGLTRLPGVSSVLERAYGVFARNRLRWTGRCADGQCAVTPSPSERP